MGTMPIYETQMDRDNEAAVGALIGERMGLRLHKTRHLHRVDFAGYDANDKKRCFIEVKCRKNAHDVYPTYKVDKDKVDHIYDLAKEEGIKGFLFVSFTDYLCAIDVHKVRHLAAEEEIWRKDRNDANDRDWAYAFPLSALKIVHRW